MASRFSEPSPRWGHYSAAVGGQLYVYGGYTKDFSKGKSELGGCIHSFNQFTERWRTRATTGTPHPGVCDGACTFTGYNLYLYGGHDGSNHQDSLYKLDINSLEWSQLPSGPMRMKGCGMVSYQEKLILFGGHGYPSGPTQPGAEFIKDSSFTDGRGWTNELHMFDVQKGMWSSPTVTGTRPPPCAAISLTMVDDHHAVLFGGTRPIHGVRNRVYILDLMKMHWSELDKDKGPWPVGRKRHTAVCLWNGGDHPQLLVTGGKDGNDKVLSGAWLLDLQAGRWREVDVPGLQARCWHSATAFSLCPGLMEVTLFGGCPQWKTNADCPLIAKTTVLQFEYQEHPSSTGPPTREWTLTGMADSSQLGTRERIEEKAAKMIQAVPTSLATHKPAHGDSGTGCDANNQEAERRVEEAEGRCREAERRLGEAMEECNCRVRAAEKRADTAECRTADLERRVGAAEDRADTVEESLRECEQKLQQLETQWVVERKEIQLTGPELGRGGWATVSVATFRGVQVAAKCIHRQIISHYNISLFEREMNMAARIRHPNLLQFIGATQRGELIILTELMPTSLRRELESRQEHDLMPPQQVTSIGVDVARALNYLHLMQPHPLIHRDISSANVLLQPLPNARWRAKVSDYGTVNLLQELQTVNPGNPTYAAPEANDPTQQSPKMDIFSFGVLLLEMLTGKFPDTNKRASQLRKIVHHPLLALVRRCLSQERGKRPSASNIISELVP